MNTLISVFSTYLAVSWHAVWWIATLIVLRVLLRHRVPAVIWSWMWIVVAVRLLIPASIPATWSPYNWASGSSLAADSPITTPFVSATAPELVSGNAPPAIQSDLASAATLPGGSAAAPSWGKNPATWGRLWLAGVAVLLGIRFYSGYRLRCAIRAAQACPLETAGEVAEEARAMGIAAPRCVETDWVSSPAVCGVFRPCLLLPQSFAAQLDQAHRRLVIRHELVHCRRRDLLAQSVIHLAAVCHWFNPLAWLSARFAATDCELACDETVLQHGQSSPQDYGTTLLHLLTLRGAAPRPMATVAIVESRRQLAQRLRRIADFRSRPAWQTLAGAVAVAVLGVAGLSSETRADSKVSVLASSAADEQQKLLAAQEARVASLSNSLQSYRETNHLVGLDEQRDLAADSVRTAHREMEAATAELAAVNARLAQVQDFRNRHANLVELSFLSVQSPIASRLAELAELRTQFGELQGRYGDRNPKIVDLNARMASVEQQLNIEIDLACNRLTADAAMHAAVLKAAQARLDAAEHEATVLDRMSTGLRDRQRVLEVQEQVLRNLAAGVPPPVESPGTEYDVKDFVVNVAGTSGNRYLKTSFVVAGKDPKLREQFEANHARMMNATLNVLSAVTLNDINQPDIRASVSSHLLSAYNETLGRNLAENIYFSEFIVQ